MPVSSVKKIPTKVFGKKKTHRDAVTMLPFHYGLHVGTQISEDDVYKMLTLIEQGAKELAQTDKAFKQIADNMVEMQVRGVNSSIDFVPVHPGSGQVHEGKRRVEAGMGFPHRQGELAFRNDG